MNFGTDGLVKESKDSLESNGTEVKMIFDTEDLANVAVASDEKAKAEVKSFSDDAWNEHKLNVAKLKSDRREDIAGQFMNLSIFWISILTFLILVVLFASMVGVKIVVFKELSILVGAATGNLTVLAGIVFKYYFSERD